MNERLIELLLQNEGKFISGERIGEEMRCSRTAIWKHMQTLRRSGYEIEAVPRLGYRLTGTPDRFDVESLKANMTTAIFGKEIVLLDEVDSTQNVAHELVRRGAAEGTLVIAEQQTSGRGRFGRPWLSPRGKGIWMSLILKPSLPVHGTPQLTLLVAVALCRTIRAMLPLDVGIKWPNDLLVGGKKISGILLESSAEDERLNYVVAGVGISVNLNEADYPDDLKQKATSLRIASGQPVDRVKLITAFLAQLEELYTLYLQQGFAPIGTLWEALSVSLHRPIRAVTSGGTVEGVAEAVDPSGALLVRTADGTLVKVVSGDIHTESVNRNL